MTASRLARLSTFPTIDHASHLDDDDEDTAAAAEVDEITPRREELLTLIGGGSRGRLTEDDDDVDVDLDDEVESPNRRLENSFLIVWRKPFLFPRLLEVDEAADEALSPDEAASLLTVDVDDKGVDCSPAPMPPMMEEMRRNWARR